MVSQAEQEKLAESFMTEGIHEEGLQNLLKINRLIQRWSNNASVIFTALPPLPSGEMNAQSYVRDLDTLSGECIIGHSGFHFHSISVNGNLWLV